MYLRICPLLQKGECMKEEKMSIIFDLITGVVTVIVIGIVVWMIPYQKASQRDLKEAVIIDEYLDEKEVDKTVVPKSDNVASEIDDTDIDSTEHQRPAKNTANNKQYYKGTVDSILVIDKIGLEKAIIRGTDNDYNLSRYLFVTADQTSVLGEDNYVIYGHCSQTYGHSFNRLDEMQVGDSFQLIQGTETYQYTITDIQLELRENASALLNTGSNTVQLVSCEKKRVEGFPEKRLIIVTAAKAS